MSEASAEQVVQLCFLESLMLGAERRIDEKLGQAHIPPQ